MEIQRLDDKDWEALLRVEVFRLGNRDWPIRPVGSDDLGEITESLKRISGELSEEGVTLDNFRTEKLDVILTLVVSNAPEIIEKLTGLHRDDIRKLPLDVLVALFNKALDVNLASQDDLAKNLTALAEKMGSLAAGAMQSTPSSPSFERGTAGESSETTAPAS
jgi:hypothetical protein